MLLLNRFYHLWQRREQELDLALHQTQTITIHNRILNTPILELGS